MKLDHRRVLLILKMKNNNETTYQIKKKVRVTIQRVNQIWKQYRDSGDIPKVGDKSGRPRKIILLEWIEIIKKAYSTY